MLAKLGILRMGDPVLEERGVFSVVQVDKQLNVVVWVSSSYVSNSVTEAEVWSVLQFLNADGSSFFGVEARSLAHLCINSWCC